MKGLGDVLLHEMLARIDRPHLDMLFYFALKKTGNRQQAEELAQEIAYEAVVTLSKGHAPASFEPWLWGVARNRYARWVQNRRDRLYEVAPGALIDFHAAHTSTDTDPESALLEREQRGLLRRELALLCKEHREIVLAYYFERKRVSDIASSLGVPEGTVKQKLYMLRKHLREGMHMARDSGQRSYAPEEVSFSMSGENGHDGSPWSLLQRSIPKNILLEAYNNPCTVEELSLALGIAVPYMEEEVSLLKAGTLVTRLADGRYETDFIILSKEMQAENFQTMMATSRSFCPQVLESLDGAIDRIREIGFIQSDMPSAELYWLLLLMAVDFVVGRVRKEKGVPPNRTPRPHNGYWDLMGYERWSIPFSTFVGCNGYGPPDSHFVTYKIRMNELWDRAGQMHAAESALVADILRNGRPVNSLSTPERLAVDTLVQRGFLTYCGEKITTTFPVFDESRKGELSRLNAVWEHVLAEAVCQLIAVLFDTYVRRIQSEVPARLEQQVRFAAGDLLCEMRMMIIRHALEQGRIEIPHDIAKSTIAMHMRI